MDLIEGNGVSLYYQLQEILKRKIEKKVWRAGDKIPNEIDLAEQYKVSRSTVRQAVLQMVREGLLVRKKGIGTFVAKEKFNAPIAFEFCYPEEFGTKHEVISKKIIPAGEDLIQNLNLAVQEAVFELIRLRYFNDEPVAIESVYLPESLFPNFFAEDLEGRIFDVLDRKYNLQIKNFDVVIEPIILKNHDKCLFKLGKNPEAGLKMTRICYNEAGEPYLMHHSVFRGDCCNLLFKSKLK